MEEVGHMVDPLVVDAAAVHLAYQGVPLLPSCPSLPPLSPPSLLAQPSFQAAGTTLQGSGGGSSPNNLGFTPSLHILTTFCHQTMSFSFAVLLPTEHQQWRNRIERRQKTWRVIGCPVPSRLPLVENRLLMIRFGQLIGVTVAN